MLAELLEKQGYCTIRVPQDQKAHAALEKLAQDSVLWTRPQPTFAEAYFGADSGDTALLKIDDALEQEPNKDDCAWYPCVQPLVNACGLTQSSVGNAVDPKPAHMMLRRGSPEEVFPLMEETVIEHLDFLRRRKVCLMSFVNAATAGKVTLTPRSDGESVDVDVTTGTMLMFRHDLLNYHYKSARKQRKLILQAWVLEAARDIAMPPVQGRREDIMEFLEKNGTKLARRDDPHIMSIGGHWLSCHGEHEIFRLLESGCDGQLEVPKLRWDHDIYYSPNPLDGLAINKHLGAIDTFVMDSFDNEFWKIKADFAKAGSREKLKTLEVAYETLNAGGFTRETLRGAPISLGVGNAQSFEWDWAGTAFAPTLNVADFSAFYLGLIGKRFIADTACSSAMVAANELNKELLIARDGHQVGNRAHGYLADAIALGTFTVYDPLFMIGMGMAHMMGASGRSTSWDASANGFGVGDAVVGMYFCLQNAESKAADNQLAAIAGSSTNQDGRSASLTAPNGPAQTAVFREALQNSGTRPHEVTFNECHATGTKLGDTIEVGSTRVCFNERDFPLGHGGYKSMSGHPIMASGIVAIIKQVMCMRYGKLNPNCHLHDLNPNMDVAGYPHFMQSEPLESGMHYMIHCCTGMGFGGANCRFELASNCSKGIRSAPRMASTPSGAVAFLDQAPSKKQMGSDAVPYVLVSCPECLGDMCFRCCQAFVTDNDYTQDHHCYLVREASAAYDRCSLCYKGIYVEGTPPSSETGNPGYDLSLVGSWSSWSSPQLMRKTTDEYGDICYTQTVTLDDAGRAEFRLLFEEDKTMMIYPVVKQAGPKARIIGPDSHHKGRSWLIDGSIDGALAGARYEIKFSWNFQGKAMEWRQET